MVLLAMSLLGVGVGVCLPVAQANAPAPVRAAAAGLRSLAGGFKAGGGRFLDTRVGTGAPKGAVGPGKSITVQTYASDPVAINLTVTGATGAGYLTAYASGGPRPTVSNLNFVAGQTVANLAIVPAGSDGNIVLFNGSSGTVQIIGDYGGSYPATAPTGSGYLAPGQGSGSSLNFTPGQTVSNLVVVSTFDAGYVPFFNGSPNGSVQIVADIVGYYAGDPGLPWTLPQKIDAANALTSVSCAVPVSAIKCVAVDNLGNALISSAVDATAKWTKQAKIDRVGLTSVACATKFCIALDVSGRATVFNGTSWSAPSAVAIAKEALRRVSCAPTSCIATGATTAVQYSGTTWKAPVILDPAHHLQNVSCLSATFCLAVDGSAGADGKSFQFNGTTWSKPTPIVSGGKVGTVACDIPYSEGPDLAFCVAGDTSGNGFRYDGRTWVEQKAVNPDEGGIRFLACSRDPYTLCFAGGFHSSTVALYDEPNVGRFFRGGWVPATIIEPAPSGVSPA